MSNDWRDEHERRIYRMARRAERAQKVGIGVTIGCAAPILLVLVLAIVAIGSAIR